MLKLALVVVLNYLVGNPSFKLSSIAELYLFSDKKQNEIRWKTCACYLGWSYLHQL